MKTIVRLLTVRNLGATLVLAVATLAVLTLLPCPAAADYNPIPPPEPFCVWCPYPYCCRNCGFDELCVFPCNGCASSSDPVFVSMDSRDLSVVLRERRDMSASSYKELAHRLAEELAAR